MLTSIGSRMALCMALAYSSGDDGACSCMMDVQHANMPFSVHNKYCRTEVMSTEMSGRALFGTVRWICGVGMDLGRLVIFCDCKW